jgi:transcriptional regulator with GAF, ATPase, and Fis domain
MTTEMRTAKAGTAGRRDAGRAGRLLAAARALHEDLALPRVLERILDEAIAALHAERGFLVLFTPDGFEIASARYLDRSAVARAGLRLSRTLLERLRRERQPLVLADALDAPDLAGAPSVRAQQLRSVLALPLSLPPAAPELAPRHVHAPVEDWSRPPAGGAEEEAGDGILGAIVLDNRFRGGVFAEGDAELAEAFGAHAALAVRNARLVDALRARTEALETARAEVERLTAALREKVAAQAEELDRSRELLTGRFDLGGMVGRSDALAKTVALLRKVAPTDFRVLLQGESGTGKELAARALHANSPRRARPFVSLNCATLPESLLAAELFGAARGAYTGANADRAGFFVQADGGTLFLDEVGTMRPEMQESLLRVLQEGEVRPLGGSRARKVDVRVVAATNIPLDRLVAAGRFRQDLLFRLNAVTVLLPPLRERPEDIPLLAEHFLEAAAREGKAPRRTLAPGALRALAGHPWPGNVRELENVIRTAAALADGPVLDEEEIRARLGPAGPAPGPDDAVPGREGPLRTLDDYIRDMILAHGGRMSDIELSRRLGITRKSLWEKRKRFGLL